MNKIKIKEIFSSIQGEGPYVGEAHIFLRTTKCNLSCAYCDTDFLPDEKTKEYDFENLFNTLVKQSPQVLSLTGGEPLCEVEFFKEFLENYKEKLGKKIYLETNGTKFNELLKIIEFVDVISMDIKLKSATGLDLDFEVFDKFLNVATKKETFVKVVFDEKIEELEIEKVLGLVKKYDVLLVLQPKMPMNFSFDYHLIYEKFYEKYKNVRLIPQVHKFLEVR